MQRDKSPKDTVIKRKNSPSPQSYMPELAKDKSIVNLNNFSGKMNKAKDIKFIESLVREKSKIPGVGYYKNLERSLDYRSKGSQSRYKLGL